MTTKLIDHDGSGLPVDADTVIEVRHRDKSVDDGVQRWAGYWNTAWSWPSDSENATDVIRYRIVKEVAE